MRILSLNVLFFRNIPNVARAAVLSIACRVAAKNYGPSPRQPPRCARLAHTTRENQTAFYHTRHNKFGRPPISPSSSKRMPQCRLFVSYCRVNNGYLTSVSVLQNCRYLVNRSRDCLIYRPPEIPCGLVELEVTPASLPVHLKCSRVFTPVPVSQPPPNVFSVSPGSPYHTDW